MKPKKNLFRAALALAGVAVILSACVTRPTYRPRAPGESVGYTDERISENRARVTFSGGTSTTRRNVENYLMLRAAEVTLAAGYPAFVFDDRNVETERSYYRTDFGTFGAWPYWRRFGPYAWYYSSWRFSDPFFDRIETTTRYSAYAEIIMLRREQADREARAINAQEVVDRLRPPPPPDAGAPPPPPPPN
jgi:hypothetical protein